MKPIIGIIGSPYTNVDKEIMGVNSKIIEKIDKHGGKTIGIFPTPIVKNIEAKTSTIDLPNKIEKQDLIDMLKMCDAIIKADAKRISRYEKYLIDRALEKGLPFLGIDAGMQSMANYGKNTTENSNCVKNEYGINHNVKRLYAHSILINKASNLYNIIGKEEIEVNSTHDTHIVLATHKFTVSAQAPDHIIEAIENPNHHFQIGLEWHPELLNDENSDRLFESFIEEASKQKVKKLFFHR